jgi:hypothetical protein
MRDIATATLTGNLTREVELRPLPSGTEVARLWVASGTRRRSGEEWVERTNYFTGLRPAGNPVRRAPQQGLASWSRASLIGGSGPIRSRAGARRAVPLLGTKSIHGHEAEP